MMEKTWNLNMAARCVCSSPNSTSTKAPNGSMVWSLWSATVPVSGNREDITTTPTPGKRSGTGKHQEQEKFNKSQQSACRLLAFIELLLLLMLTSPMNSSCCVHHRRKAGCVCLRRGFRCGRGDPRACRHAGESSPRKADRVPGPRRDV